jgi:hypothetical protein
LRFAIRWPVGSTQTISLWPIVSVRISGRRRSLIATPRSAAGEHLRQHIDRHDIGDQPHLRAGFPEGLQGARQEGQRRRRGAGEPHGSRLPAAQIERESAEALDVPVQPLRLGQQLLGLRRRHQPPALALEQLESQLVLGMQQQLAERRLRDIQRLRRAGQRAAAHDGAEDLNLADIHGLAPAAVIRQHYASLRSRLWTADLTRR